MGTCEAERIVTSVILLEEEGEVQHTGFSEQLNNDPCDLRSQERLIYPGECEHIQEAVMNPLSIDREMAVPTTEKTPLADTSPARASPVRAPPAGASPARASPVRASPVVDGGQTQSHPAISINRINVQVLTRERSAPCGEG
jgi:hypothetical protein